MKIVYGYTKTYESMVGTNVINFHTQIYMFMYTYVTYAQSPITIKHHNFQKFGCVYHVYMHMYIYVYHVSPGPGH